MSTRKPKVEIYRRKNKGGDGSFGYRIKGGNGETMTNNEGYATKAGAKRGYNDLYDVVTKLGRIPEPAKRRPA